ncbi:MAG: UbiA family prenyltransferase [Verrucomicrobia bacterium]|nr:UbiA family prenyltransferase [Verrucomicrobiota bacterium]
MFTRFRNGSNGVAEPPAVTLISKITAKTRELWQQLDQAAADANIDLSAWLELVRIPNLLTVPGDPVAGFLLAAHGGRGGFALLVVAAASICFYMAGLIINDLTDIEEDRTAHHDRPLPAGRIERRHAANAAGIAMGIGLLLCILLGKRTVVIGLCLLGMIATYNFSLKSLPFLGHVNMGLCRGLSLLLGAAAVPALHPFSSTVVGAAIVLSIYVALISYIAAQEIAPRDMSVEAWLPLLTLAGGLAILGTKLHLVSFVAQAGFAVALTGACVVAASAGYRIMSASSMEDDRDEFRRIDDIAGILPGTVGLLLSGLVFVQAALIFGAGSTYTAPILAFLLLAAWPVQRKLRELVCSS